MTGRRRSDVEARALRLIDRAQAGQIAEEDLAELKSWDADPVKTARRLAGLANSARGDRILLLLGVADDGHAADPTTASDVVADSLQWYEQVVAEFTSPPPYLETGPVAVPVDGAFASAFEFATDQPPYMVRNPLRGQGGQVIDHEVPWREATKVRTARHGDLVRLLAPLTDVVPFDLLGGRCTFTPATERKGATLVAALRLYVIPPPGRYVTIPQHRVAMRARLDDDDEVDLTDISIYAPGDQDSLFSEQIDLDIATVIEVSGNASVPNFQRSEVEVTATFDAVPDYATTVARARLFAFEPHPERPPSLRTVRFERL